MESLSVGKRNSHNDKEESISLQNAPIKKKHRVLVLASVSKALFTLLAMGGYFNAKDYTRILDYFSEMDGIELHSDAEIDDLLDTMENHEEKRMKLAKALRTFTSYVTIFRKNTQQEDVTCKMDLSAETFERMEDTFRSLSSNISSHQSFVAKERKKINQARISLLREVKRFMSASIIFPILDYMTVFQLLLRQYEKQLDWEGMIILKIHKMLLQDGKMYRYLEPDGGKDDSSILTRGHLNIWATGIEYCVKLDKDTWSSVKNKFLFDMMAVGDCLGTKTKSITMHRDATTPFATHSMTRIIQERLRVSTVDKNIGKSFILSSQSVQNVLNSFVGYDIFHPEICKCGSLNTHTETNRSGSAFFLLLGPSGSGKTFLCDMIEEKVSSLNMISDVDSPIGVIRPSIPADLLGSCVGSFEDAILSIFAYIKCCVKYRKCILLLDGIEHILGNIFINGTGNKFIDESSNVNDNHMTCRIRSIFMAAMDRFREIHLEGGKMLELLVICTARSKDDDIADRFDGIFHMLEPDSIERRLLVEACLGLPVDCEQIGLGEQLARVVSSTLGKSRGEIAQICRRAVEVFPKCDSIGDCASRLNQMLNFLQQTLPDSLRGVSSSNAFVDMRVSSAKELLSTVKHDGLNENGRQVFPLLGKSAYECWKQIENIIIAPLCRWESLDHLINGNGSPRSAQVTDRKVVSSGLLLTGDSGTGKTAISYHCAAVAAGINPAIKLIEVSCTSLVHKELGGSERSVRKLFETARISAPCILLLDGIENIAPVRGHDNTTEGTMDRLLSTLLTEIDGISSHAKKESSGADGKLIAVIGITHNPPSWIDPALLRPGRLEKCLLMKKPDSATRKEIFFNAIQDLSIDFSDAGFFDPKDKTQLAEAVALRSHNKSAADIIALCENAKVRALREVLRTLDETEIIKSNMSVSYRHFSSNLD